MNEWKLGYLAGIIDGEGCISITKAGDKYKTSKGFYHFTVRLTVCSNDKTMIEFLQKEFGGNFTPRNTTGDYRIYWSGDKLKKLLNSTKDYLIIKKKQAELFLSMPCEGRGYYYSVEEQERRMEAYIKMKELNSPRVSFVVSSPHIGVGEEKEEDE